MHPAIKEKLMWMKEEREVCRGEYFATRHMYKGAKELAAEMQPVIDQLIAERDTAVAELVAELAAMKATESLPFQWLPNTGEDPDLPMVVVRFRHGGLSSPGPSYVRRWYINDDTSDVTHYWPVPEAPKD